MEAEANAGELTVAQKLTEQQRNWLQHYQASQASGESMAVYAREHGLAIKSFYYWKKRLRQLGAIASGPTATPLVFQQVRIKPLSPRDVACRVRFPNGMDCELSGLDKTGIESVLSALSRLPQ